MRNGLIAFVTAQFSVVRYKGTPLLITSSMLARGVHHASHLDHAVSVARRLRTRCDERARLAAERERANFRADPYIDAKREHHARRRCHRAGATNISRTARHQTDAAEQH